MAKNSTLLKLGIGGTLIATLCCFTPVLLILLSAVGLGALTDYLDYVLLPSLVIFAGIAIYAFSKRQQAQACCTTDNPGKKQ